MTRGRSVRQRIRPTPPNEPPAATEPSSDEIAARAYALYMERGCLDGRDVEDWLQAERELLGRQEEVTNLPGPERAQGAGSPVTDHDPARLR